ncbi:VOC family protein [Micromonospora sp. NPDC006431]
MRPDCADPRAIARFWSEAMDWTLREPHPSRPDAVSR